MDRFSFLGTSHIGFIEDLYKEYLSDPDVRSLLQPSQRYVKFLWGIPQMSEGEEIGRAHV